MGFVQQALSMRKGSKALTNDAVITSRCRIIDVGGITTVLCCASAWICYSLINDLKLMPDTFTDDERR